MAMQGGAGGGIVQWGRKMGDVRDEELNDALCAHCAHFVASTTRRKRCDGALVVWRVGREGPQQSRLGGSEVRARGGNAGRHGRAGGSGEESRPAYMKLPQPKPPVRHPSPTGTDRPWSERRTPADRTQSASLRMLVWPKSRGEGDPSVLKVGNP